VDSVTIGCIYMGSDNIGYRFLVLHNIWMK